MPHRVPSLRNQVDHALRSIFKPGESRKVAKQRGDDKFFIFGYETLFRYISACITMLEALEPDERPSMLREVDAQVFAKGLDALRRKGNSDKTLSVQLAAWRKLIHATKSRQGTGTQRGTRSSRSRYPGCVDRAGT